jgi:hypothetical protein
MAMVPLIALPGGGACCDPLGEGVWAEVVWAEEIVTPVMASIEKKSLKRFFMEQLPLVTTLCA